MYRTVSATDEGFFRNDTTPQVRYSTPRLSMIGFHMDILQKIQQWGLVPGIQQTLFS